MEPEALNTLELEAENLKQKVKDDLGENIPKDIEYLFCETAFFFLDEALANWRRFERYDELIEYILWNYKEKGGVEFWKQVLLDLRLKKDEDRAHRLLDGLYAGRSKRFWDALKNFKKHPENHFSAATCAQAKGEVMEVLYEHAFLVENKPEAEQNTERVQLVRQRIWEISSEKRVT
ncbi:hypothetical protein [Pseudoalteromonas sp. SR43-5]|uniref:hypothetical protein n=1 Tax=Pseudoalteromonas sp. SR43-5 TaxID=2760941 RepID=UPI0015F92A37|nr:hypothetical protein [Pseudoalteromonas sp. SR43-5]MBB1307812.1 hypothetical protein [Pseudoalteromonas sp. SR43-5]